MKTLSPFLAAALAAPLLGGCGAPAPSTTLAPEQKLPDVSKMSDAEIARMRAGDHAGDRSHGSKDSVPATSSTGR